MKLTSRFAVISFTEGTWCGSFYGYEGEFETAEKALEGLQIMEEETHAARVSLRAVLVPLPEVWEKIEDLWNGPCIATGECKQF